MSNKSIAIKKNFFSPLWKVFSIYERELNNIHSELGELYVVMGFQRNGTSLVSNLVRDCGVYFGEDDEMRGPDFRNPHGFFEHEDIFDLSRKFIRESGQTGNNDLFDDTVDFRPATKIQRVSRVFTRIRMIKTVKRLGLFHKKWGFKLLPTFLYFWQNYLPKFKIIGVYRDPYSTVRSIIRGWPAGIATTVKLIDHWTRGNLNMIYHLTQHESILIKYDDLMDEKERERILHELVSFIGAGNIENITQNIDKSIYSIDERLVKMRNFLPLSEETKAVYDMLEKLKV